MSEKSKCLTSSKISLWEWKEASCVKAFGRLSSKPMGDIRNFLRAEDSISWPLIPSPATRTASYRHSGSIRCMNEWNMAMQRLWREGETGNVLGKLRLSKDEAAEGGAGQAANTSLTSCAQLPGHRPSKAQGTALKQVGQELLPSQAGWCHARNALLLQPAFSASVPGDRKHNRRRACHWAALGLGRAGLRDPYPRVRNTNKNKTGKYRQWCRLSRCQGCFSLT